ncbi:hypothetical protein Entcl_4322 [[Enterobacter] lignolyticus SCF1]|uniref:Uncharacterized protein n=1 Tax=Enterobacter lignolyticus (strain SCF1) TaxID=701347 RepID=E3G4T4_ENTLS|nr:hypothetical protein Entcl_4322 [[Enterobacter] lignolyticus SCF1]
MSIPPTVGGIFLPASITYEFIAITSPPTHHHISLQTEGQGMFC